MLEAQPMPSGENQPVQSLEDLEAAKQLIEEDEELSNHPRVKQLLANDFEENGRVIDAGNFLAAVKNYRETQSGQISPEMIEKALVEYSPVDDNNRKQSDPEDFETKH